MANTIYLVVLVFVLVLYLIGKRRWEKMNIEVRIVNLFEKYLKQTIKDVENGLLILDGDKQYISKCKIDFNIDLKRIMDKK